MAKLENRVHALEQRSGGEHPPCHELIRNEGETLTQAVEAYGRDKIGPNDNCIVWTVVEPLFDANGKMIRRSQPQHKRDLRPLSELLEWEASSGKAW